MIRVADLLRASNRWLNKQSRRNELCSFCVACWSRRRFWSSRSYKVLVENCDTILGGLRRGSDVNDELGYLDGIVLYNLPGCRASEREYVFAKMAEYIPWYSYCMSPLDYND